MTKNFIFVFKNFVIAGIFFFHLNSIAQTFTRQNSIPVSSVSSLEMPWTGGINFPLLSEIKLNDDTLKDLFIFDRSNNRSITFINNGSSGSHCWIYAPEYESAFPPMHGWAFLYDYNCDNKPDIFTVNYFNSGISAYRNDSQNGVVTFTLVDSTIKYLCNCPSVKTNVFASDYLMADFNDIDGDGDMDIVGQQFICVGGFAYYKNMSLEDYGTCDSLNDYVLVTNTWGKFALRSGSFQNVVVGSWNVNCFQSGDDNSYQISKRDDTYAYIHTIDIDGDGDKDALIGDSQANNSLLVVNGGTNLDAHMVSQDTLFPSYDVPVNIHSFAAHNYVDADNDGKKDLIVTQSEYENKHGLYFYKNSGSTASPVFSKIESDFLQNEMIDVGESAAPVFFDYDGDGLQDLFIGNKLATVNDSTYTTGISLFKNVGTLSTPSFEFVTDDFAGIQTIISSAHLHGQIYPAFGDLDGDSDADLIFGTDEGQLVYMNNTAGVGSVPVYDPPVFSYMSIDVGQASTPQIFDLNKDGLPDLIVGEKSGLLNYFQNVGAAATPFFSSSPTNDSLGGADLIGHLQNQSSPDGYSVPYFFNQNGNTQLLVSCMKGNIYLYDSIDGNLQGSFNLVDTVFSKTFGSRYGYNVSVSGGDLNNDALTDIVVGLYGGGVQIFFQDNPSIGIADLSSESTINIYPNPTADKIYIRSSLINEKATSRIIDITGRIIKTTALANGNGNFEISDITQGVYIINVESPQYNLNKKIVISR